MMGETTMTDRSDVEAMAHDHAERYHAALARAHGVRSVAHNRRWYAVLLLLTTREGLWDAYSDRIDYTKGTVELDEAPYLGVVERLLLDVARSLLEGPRSVDIAACCTELDDRAFEVVVAAVRLMHGEKTATLDLWDPFRMWSAS